MLMVLLNETNSEFIEMVVLTDILHLKLLGLNFLIILFLMPIILVTLVNSSKRWANVYILTFIYQIKVQKMMWTELGVTGHYKRVKVICI